MGMDSDHPLAAGEVGKVGVSINTLHDMEAMLNGIPLDQVSTSMTINATAPILLAMYVAVAKKQGVSPHAINGTLQNDILKEISPAAHTSILRRFLCADHGRLRILPARSA
jgi:methylmalonyl-CoA mutase N-terminal domain/subunit